LGFPKPVQVAIGVNGDRLVFATAKIQHGLRVGRQSPPLSAVLGFDVHEADKMRVRHWVGDAADGNTDAAATIPAAALRRRHHRQVLFRSGLGRVGHELRHFCSAAHHGDAVIVDKADQVPAMGTDEEFLHNDISPFLNLSGFYSPTSCVGLLIVI